MADPTKISRDFFQAYADGERDTAASLLAENVTAYITNADAGVDMVTGRDDYMARVPDLKEAGGTATVIQVVGVDRRARANDGRDQGPRTARKRSLHNHAPSSPGSTAARSPNSGWSRRSRLQRRVLVVASG